MNLFSDPQKKRLPKIDFNLEKGELSFSGNSMPEDVNACYAPLMKAIEEHSAAIKNQKHVFTVIINFDYFNSASLKFIVSLIKQLITLTNGNGVKVDWYYDKDDTDMLETATEVSNILSLPFTCIERERTL